MRRLPRLPAALAWDWCLDATQPGRLLVVSTRLTPLSARRRFARAARACALNPALPLGFAFDVGTVAACYYTCIKPGPVPQGGELWSPFDALRPSAERL